MLDNREPTYRNRPHSGLLPPPSSALFVVLRAPLRQAAVSCERSADLSLFSLIAKWEREVKHSLVPLSHRFSKLSMGVDDWSQPAASI